MHVSRKRSIAKSLTYRVVCTTETFLFAWLLTGRVWVASGLAGALLLIKTVTFYLHERAWDRTDWGRG